MPKILIIEDNQRLANRLAKKLTLKHFIVEVAGNGREGEYLAQANNYDLILLDLNLPGRNGLDVCRNLRQSKNQTPVIMLTARSSIPERITGLEAGADDYLPKPFSMNELEARIRSILRRQNLNRSPILETGPFTLDPHSHTFFIKKIPTYLTPKNFAIMELLMQHPGEIIPLTKIIESVWHDPIDVLLTNTLNVHICNLRKALGSKKFIKTFTNTGFMLVLD